MKILTILGARPQFVKASSVSRAINNAENISEVIVHTGQHFDSNMSKIFFDEMHIPVPKYNLNINGLSHGAMTGQMIEKIEEILQLEKPDWVLVYGDTNSTLAGSIAASKLHIKVAHVEAGLRSFNMKMPEEINRILTDRVSDVLFCPTSSALNNLKQEGYPNISSRGCNQSIVNVGDVMQDSAIYYKDFATKPDVELANNYILATVHRAENTDNKERLSGIFDALNEIAKTKQVVLPLHPRTKAILEKNYDVSPNITMITPVGYLEMVYLIMNSDLIMTDSGGLQKEAFFFKKPCITLRDETEWVELIENQYNVLVGADKNKILDVFTRFDFNQDYDRDLYGAGSASKRIVDKLISI
ncbi:UDP-2,3-diacetamido-2,3-dideoxy-D-glucuronate 2-epimerase [Psychromonas marina]|uniref:UDP-2,3-diacetamido-2,3-dideoxy-D-glucuronate 2-epimerase n=1 Tax=Psychromonas marina TaxID=88364 RepID=A0ABQ6DWT5_9GAMM|nr:UDP-N-acetylglucosamine 2-epimerase (non-hydrolyzing) [Psychromonas marina]GLS89613.1 UDP-2,3-diacetamido-2,3-dideoxy-D-glucuronate 2-epimerase [Psychromonas marina]